MDWGLLSGIGNALQGFGGQWTADAKEELRNKLAEDREARAEQRQVAREDRAAQRQADTVAGYRPEIDSSGVLWIQGHNSAGDARGEKRMATPSELQQYKLEQDKQKLTLEDLASRAAVNKFKAGRLESEAAQDDAYAKARLGLVNAQTNAANYRASGAGGGRSGRVSLEEETAPVALSDLTSSLVAQEKKLLEEYGLTIAEQNMLVKSVLQQARANGKDPVDTLRQALPVYVKTMKGNKTKGKSGLLNN
jgi:hypothetical protein